MSNVIQRIIFGSPGTGKSHLIKAEIIPELIKDEKRRKSNVINAVFHPEYTYGNLWGNYYPSLRKMEKWNIIFMKDIS